MRLLWDSAIKTDVGNPAIALSLWSRNKKATAEK